MIADSALQEKRDQLKRQLAAGEYRMLLERMIDATGRLLQRLTQRQSPVSPWLGALVLALVSLAVGLLPPLALGELRGAQIEAIALVVSGIVTATANLMASKVALSILLDTLHDHVLDAIESEEDLSALQGWLETRLRVRAQVGFGLLYSALMVSYSVISAWVTRASVGPGLALMVGITSFQNGTLLYMFFPIVSFCARLGHCHIKLYAADPGSSEIIVHLSDMISGEAFIGVALSAFSTVVHALLGQLTVTNAIPLVLMGWVPCIVVFGLGQRALGALVSRAKWKTLNEIQGKIETLTAEQDLVQKETTDAVNRLMDLHDRIKAVRNSALDVRAGLRFLNSLLLPLLAFLLTNVDRVLQLFR
jgi:hypothetical protein